MNKVYADYGPAAGCFIKMFYEIYKNVPRGTIGVEQ